MRPHVALRTFAACLPAVLTGCGIFGDSRPGLAKVEDLVDRIEHVHVEAELAKDASRTAVRRLATLAAPDFSGNPVQAHTDLIASVDASEQQAERLLQGVDAMEAAAGPVFEQWRDDLDAIVSARVRTRSEQRLRETRARYEAIVSRVRPALEEYEALNRSLRDLALFLGHDFNAAAVQDVGEDVRALDSQVGALDQQLDASLTAARSYLDEAAPMQAGDLVERAAAPVAGPGAEPSR